MINNIITAIAALVTFSLLSKPKKQTATEILESKISITSKLSPKLRDKIILYNNRYN